MKLPEMNGETYKFKITLRDFNIILSLIAIKE